MPILCLGRGVEEGLPDLQRQTRVETPETSEPLREEAAPEADRD